MKLSALVFLVCTHAMAALILDISDPNQTVVPGDHALFHGTLINTDSVPYTVVTFLLLNPPTDATEPPTGDQIFPLLEPAVPFGIAAAVTFAGIVTDIAVPRTAQMKNHVFSIEAVTDSHTAGGQSIVSNMVSASLNVAVPEPDTGILIAISATLLSLWRSRHPIGRTDQVR